MAGNSILDLVLFLVLVFGLTIVSDLLFKEVTRRRGKEVLSEKDLDIMAYGVIRMYLPLISSLIVTVLSTTRLSAALEFIFQWLRINSFVIIVSLITPLIPFAVTLLYIEAARTLSFLDRDALNKILERIDSSKIKAWLKLLSLSYAASLTANAIVALGEEYGWRAFLFQKLYTYTGLVHAIIVSGIIWGLWHIPLVLLLRFKSEYYDPRINSMQYILFCTILAVPESVLLLKTNSILPAAVFHGAVNSIWRITEPITKLTRENKIAIMVYASIVSLLLWLLVSIIFSVLLWQL